MGWLVELFAEYAVGDLTQHGSSAYTYDAENRLKARRGVDYSYDGDERRVKKFKGTLYWYGLSGNLLSEIEMLASQPQRVS